MAADFKLTAGDKVALIAPASGQKFGQNNHVQHAIDLLTTWGLDVEILPQFSTDARYLSAADTVRQSDLIKALTHVDIKAIFVTRGGYGCARLLANLPHVDVPSPRFLVGFSDITTLHLQFVDVANVLSVHAPNVATSQFLDDTANATDNRQALYRYLFKRQHPTFTLTTLHSASPACPTWSSLQKTPCIGGCLSLLVTSLGTPHSIDTTDKILMIEEVGESPYKIDRMLTHLKNAGQFDHVKAVIFGEMFNCHSPQINIDDVLRDFFAETTFPVFNTQTFGHGSINQPWGYGEPLTVRY